MNNRHFNACLTLILLLACLQSEARTAYKSFAERALTNVTAPVLHTVESINIDWNVPDTNKARKGAIPARHAGSLRDQDPEYIRWHKAHTGASIANTGGSMMALGAGSFIGALMYNDMADTRQKDGSAALFVVSAAIVVTIIGLSMLIAGSQITRKYRPHRNGPPRIRE